MYNYNFLLEAFSLSIDTFFCPVLLILAQFGRFTLLLVNHLDQLYSILSTKIHQDQRTDYLKIHHRLHASKMHYKCLSPNSLPERMCCSGFLEIRIKLVKQYCDDNNKRRNFNCEAVRSNNAECI